MPSGPTVRPSAERPNLVLTCSNNNAPPPYTFHPLPSPISPQSPAYDSLPPSYTPAPTQYERDGVDYQRYLVRLAVRDFTRSQNSEQWGTRRNRAAARRQEEEEDSRLGGLLGWLKWLVEAMAPPIYNRGQQIPMLQAGMTQGGF